MVWEGTEGQNMRPNRLSHNYICVLFVNATIGFAENLFLVENIRPTCFFSAGDVYDPIHFRYFRVVVDYEGSTYWEPGGKFASTCIIDIKYYPFDEQKCHIVRLYGILK